jgi:hypothetical protein
MFICQKWWLTNFHSALMRDRQHQPEPPKKERFSFAENKNASVHLPKIVPDQPSQCADA